VINSITKINYSRKYSSISVIIKMLNINKVRHVPIKNLSEAALTECLTRPKKVNYFKKYSHQP